MSVLFIPVKTDDDQRQLAALADEIWHEYWPDLIGKAQTDYMVDQFQSLEAIQESMKNEAYEYWFLQAADDGRIVGYTGGHVEPETNRYFISQVIRFYESICHDRKLRAMYLTVNKYNDLGVRAYKAKGFETIDSVESDIGQGYIMDDFIMEKQLH